MPKRKYDGLLGKFSFIHGNILVVTITVGFWSFGMRMTQSYSSLYILALGASPFILGVINAVSVFILAFMRIPGGYIADRWGRKKVIYSLTFLAALTYFIYAFAIDWTWILIGSILASLSFMYQPALQAIVADSLPSEKRGIGYSIVRFLPIIIGIPASVIALLLVKDLGLVSGMRIAYMVAGTMGIMAALFRRFFLKETLTRHEAFKAEDFSAISREIFSKLFEAMRKVRKEFLRLLIVYCMFNFAASFILASRGGGGITGAGLWMVFARDVLNVNEVNWGWIVAFARVISAFSIIPLGIIVDKFGRKKSLSLFLLLTFISAILFIYPLNPYMIFIAYAIYVTAQFGFMNAYQSMRADLVPTEMRGRIISGSELVANVVSVPASILGGYLYNYIGPRAPFIVFILITLMSIIFTVLGLKEPIIKEK